jgi:hypothetical protein
MEYKFIDQENSIVGTRPSSLKPVGNTIEINGIVYVIWYYAGKFYNEEGDPYIWVSVSNRPESKMERLNRNIRNAFG